MARRESNDLSGQRFGHWTVLSRAGNRNGMIYYRCRCDCGTEREVLKKDLLSGKARACGCNRLEKQDLPGLVGKRFGMLTVTELLTEKRSGKTARYRCHCDCGTDCVKSYPSLVSKGTDNCGCVRGGSRPNREILNRERYRKVTAEHAETRKTKGD